VKEVNEGHLTKRGVRACLYQAWSLRRQIPWARGILTPSWIFLIGLKVREGNALLNKYPGVKWKQISDLQPFIYPNDNKHTTRSTNDLYSFTRPRNVQGSTFSQW